MCDQLIKALCDYLLCDLKPNKGQSWRKQQTLFKGAPGWILPKVFRQRISISSLEEKVSKQKKISSNWKSRLST